VEVQRGALAPRLTEPAVRDEIERQLGPSR